MHLCVMVASCLPVLVLHNMESRWASGDTRLKEIKAVYRLDLSASIYRRFDTALLVGHSLTSPLTDVINRSPVR